MVVQSRGAIIVLDDGGPQGADLVARVDGVWPEIYRMTDRDVPDAVHHVINVGPKHFNVKTLVKHMYEQQAYWCMVPNSLDPVQMIADLLSSARHYLADGYPFFGVISARPGIRYRSVACVLDPREPITTGSLGLASVALAARIGAHTVDGLVLGGEPDHPPGTWPEVREMFKIRDGAQMLEQAEDVAREHGVGGTWRALGVSGARDQLVLNAVRGHEYDLVVDDLRPIDVGPRIGRLKRVRRQLVEGDSIDTAYRLLRDAPGDVGIVVDAIRMRLIPANYAKGAAVAALSLGLIGVAARPPTASAAESSSNQATVEAPLDPTAEAAPEAQAAEDAAAPGATAATGTPAPSLDSIPAEVSSEQMASYEQSLAQEQSTLQAEQQELQDLQQQQQAASQAVDLATADLAIAQQDLVDAQATVKSAEAGLDYAQGARTGLSDEEVNQAVGSLNRAKHDVQQAQSAVEEAEAALQTASAQVRSATEAAAAQQAVVDAQAANVDAWSAVVNEAESRTDQRVAPVAGYSVTTQYGVAGSNWSSGYHTGSDYAAPSGTEVMAAASGTVVAAGFNGSYGNQVTIQHDDGTQTTYSHLSSITVSVGETVSAGEAIGAVGSTGNSTGPHLHFEAFDSSGNRLNPEEWLAQA